MASVFLSYARDDLGKAEAIAAALERRGHSVWWDRRLEGGSRFSQEIDQALKQSEVVLVLWSEAALQSAWVQDEAGEGRDTGRLVPAVIDNIKPPLGFRQYQAIDLCGWKGRGNAAVIDALHRAVNARAGSIEPPVAPSKRRLMIPDFRRVGTVAAVALALAIAASLYWFMPGEQVHREALRIQLSDFIAATPDVPKALPDALRDELLNALATDSVLIATADVASPNASPGFALQASVRKMSESLRFTFHLVNVHSGATVWSDTLDRPSGTEDIVPRQVAVAVSQVLRCGLGGAARYPKTLPDESLSIYMSFCEEFWADTAGKPSNPSRAVDLAHRLTEATPDFSRGWSALAEVATWAVPGDRPMNAEALHAKAVRAAEKALELDEENSEAYQALAGLQPPLAHAESEQLHLKSISVRPGDCGCEYVGYGSFLNRVGRNSEAADAYRRAHDMIPLSAEVNVRWAEGLFLTDRAEEARQIVQDVLKIWPDYAFVRTVLLRNALWTRQYDEALDLLVDPKTPLTEKERTAMQIAVRALTSGDNTSKAKAVGVILEVGETGFADVRLPVAALAALGAHREALSLASKSLRKDRSRALGVLFELPLEPARRTPQFAEVANQFGLLAYWRDSKRKPDFCKEPSPAPVCATL